MTTIARNKRAGFDYALQGHFEAGLQLTGSEVKSVKTGHASLKGSFVTVRGEELFLTNALIPRYSPPGPYAIPHYSAQSALSDSHRQSH